MNNQTLNQVISDLLKEKKTRREKKARSLPLRTNYDEGVSVGVGIALEKVEAVKKRIREQIKELEHWQKQYPYKDDHLDKILTLKWVLGEITDDPVNFKAGTSVVLVARRDAALART